MHKLIENILLCFKICLRDVKEFKSEVYQNNKRLIWIRFHVLTTVTVSEVTAAAGTEAQVVVSTPVS